MAKYFNKFPKAIYQLKTDGSLDSITNITTSFSFDNQLKENSILYYFYDIKEGETPEIIAHKYYGDIEKHWVILKLNDIVDVKEQWPLDYRSLNFMINEKYKNNAAPEQTGIIWAQQNIHSYYKLVRGTFLDTLQVNEKEYTIDQQTYNTFSNTENVYTLPNNVRYKLEVVKKYRTYYDYENYVNEKKRRIKLLKSTNINAVETEFLGLMSNGR